MTQRTCDGEKFTVPENDLELCNNHLAISK